MKSTLFLLTALFLCKIAYPQENTSGTVIYEEKVKLEIKLEGDAAQFANMMPKERTSEKVLIFTPDAALYEKNNEEKAENLDLGGQGANMVVKMVEPANKVYTDLNNKKQVEMKEFMTRFFLIESDMQWSWKLTGNTKSFLNYTCQEATCEDNGKKVTAWFTTEIPVSTGPANYAGLPGLILAIEKNDGNQTVTVKSIDLTPVAKDKLVKPDKGKKVTPEEYKKIVDEKMKEMGVQNGQGGQHMMIQIRK
jgi:GLPGLI family protein